MKTTFTLPISKNGSKAPEITIPISPAELPHQGDLIFLETKEKSTLMKSHGHNGPFVVKSRSFDYTDEGLLKVTINLITKPGKKKS
jgi:hypothetical protein